MRISDWSSDVCSSDLGRGCVLPASTVANSVRSRCPMCCYKRLKPESKRKIFNANRLLGVNPDTGNVKVDKLLFVSVSPGPTLSMNANLSLTHLILQASALAQIVLFLLVVASVMPWAVDRKSGL